VRIGINIPFYPNPIAVPGYPVYYDRRLDSTLFFYDGLYWVYVQDSWYASTWLSNIAGDGADDCNTDRFELGEF